MKFQCKSYLQKMEDLSDLVLEVAGYLARFVGGSSFAFSIK